MPEEVEEENSSCCRGEAGPLHATPQPLGRRQLLKVVTSSFIAFFSQYLKLAIDVLMEERVLLHRRVSYLNTEFVSIGRLFF